MGVIVFPVYQVDASLSGELEQLGSKRKFWFTDGQGRKLLFKANDRQTGEDWAEKIACELCRLLGLPHVKYELAQEFRGADLKARGVVCETCAPPPTSLVLGNQILLKHDPDYPQESKHQIGKHTVEAVVEAVSTLQLPPEPWRENLPEGIKTALDVFIGYVMLDAWIANQDRHHENWGALENEKKLYLAPTFDHGASMACTLRGDEERRERLTTQNAQRRIEYFVRRAKSSFGVAGSAKRLTTLEAWRAFARKRPGASTIWENRLRSIDEREVQMLLKEVPPDRLSEIGREFTLRLLIENRKRILDGEQI